MYIQFLFSLTWIYCNVSIINILMETYYKTLLLSEVGYLCQTHSPFLRSIPVYIRYDIFNGVTIYF